MAVGDPHRARNARSSNVADAATTEELLLRVLARLKQQSDHGWRPPVWRPVVRETSSERVAGLKLACRGCLSPFRSVHDALIAWAHARSFWRATAPVERRGFWREHQVR
jgi:hypothetical protein